MSTEYWLYLIIGLVVFNYFEDRERERERERLARERADRERAERRERELELEKKRLAKDAPPTFRSPALGGAPSN